MAVTTKMKHGFRVFGSNVPEVHQRDAFTHEGIEQWPLPLSVLKSFLLKLKGIIVHKLSIFCVPSISQRNLDHIHRHCHNALRVQNIGEITYCLNLPHPSVQESKLLIGFSI
jgi:hypothetical protein